MDMHKEISIKELFSKLCNADRKKLLIFFYVGTLIVHLIYFVVNDGIWMIGDPELDTDTYFFINGAHMLTQDFTGFVQKYAGMPYYWGYMVFLGILTAIFGDNFQLVGIVQIILNSASVPMLYLASEKVSDDRRIPFISSLIYMFYLSTARWALLIGSDFLGAGFMPVCLYFLFAYLKEEDKLKRIKYLIKLIISLAAYFTMRTIAATFIVCVFIIIIWKQGKKARIIAGSVFAAAAAVMVIVLVNAGDQMHTVSDNFSFMASLYKDGAIVKTLYHYIYAQDAEYGTFPFYVACLGVIFYRFFYYWTAIDVGVNNGRYYPRTTYAIAHYLPNLYIFSAMFLGMIISKFRKDREASNIRLISGIIWVCCFVQILCEINANWRYRDIIMPMCFIVCAYGTARMYDMLKNSAAASEAAS